MQRITTVLFVISAFLALACSSDPEEPGTIYHGSDYEEPADITETAGPDDDGRGLGEMAAEEETSARLPCVHGQTLCIDGKVAVCDAKFGWLVEACPQGQTCEEGQCVSAECEPLEAQCVDDGVRICSPTGTGWSEVMPCPEGKICEEGACVDPDCEPFEKMCVDDKVLQCAMDGQTWVATPCEEGEVCFEGQCIECVSDADCDEGLNCVSGTCLVPPLKIVTTALPDGMEGEPYEVQLEGEGGTTPHFWNIIDGDLPGGLKLLGDGLISGTPGESGDFEIAVELSDMDEASDEETFPFTIFGSGGDLIITTGSPLPKGEEGIPYQTSFEAAGGQPPYVWGIVEGELPAGLLFTSNGTIEGTPAAHGDFLFTVKVFDDAEPVAVGKKEFDLTIEVAPLEIIGGQEYDLWVVKIIVLPLITTVENIPIPYSQQLEAKGGVKPYYWAEQALPGFVEYLIPNSGLPDGLILDLDGKLHGSTTDTEAVVNVKIPFTQIDLSGYFFSAEVQDSQDPADSDWAIYLIPTLPVEF